MAGIWLNYVLKTLMVSLVCIFYLISYKCRKGCSLIYADILISVRCTYIRKKLLETNSLKVIVLCKISSCSKKACVPIIFFKQWLEFDQTNTDTSLRWEKDMIRFCWPWPYFQGHYIVKTLKVCTLFADILKMQQWMFINLCRYIDISMVYIHKKK